MVPPSSGGATGPGGGGAARLGGPRVGARPSLGAVVDQRPGEAVAQARLPPGAQRERGRCHQVVDLVTGRAAAGAVREVLLRHNAWSGQRAVAEKEGDGGG